jgi:hypothetical protein
MRLAEKLDWKGLTKFGFITILLYTAEWEMMSVWVGGFGAVRGC